MFTPEELTAMNGESANVQTAFLGMGVYQMKVVAITRETSTAGNPTAKVLIDSGFKNDKGDTRHLQCFFNLKGTYKDKRSGEDKPIVQLFVGFLKTCFDLETFTPEAIAKTAGKTITVSTKRDENGYIAYWYAGHVRDFKRIEATYKPKDESNGTRPAQAATPAATAPEPEPADMIYDADGNPIF